MRPHLLFPKIPPEAGGYAADVLWQEYGQDQMGQTGKEEEENGRIFTGIERCK